MKIWIRAEGGLDVIEGGVDLSHFKEMLTTASNAAHDKKEELLKKPFGEVLPGFRATDRDYREERIRTHLDAISYYEGMYKLANTILDALPKLWGKS